MNQTPPPRILLGPQIPVRNIREALQRTPLPDGPLAVVSAGWQEAESDIDDVQELVGRPLHDLRLYKRSEELMAKDPALHELARARQDSLQELQKIYRMRLQYLTTAARRVLTSSGDRKLVASEQRHAIAQLRALDRHHLKRCETIWQDFFEAVDGHTGIQDHRDSIRATLAETTGVIITGGNVAVLINRLRLFGVPELIADHAILTWSGGIMALTERIVLFHDHAPEGKRDAEVLGAGCGILKGYVVFPDAKRRLRLGDSSRMSLRCRRFSPDVCLTFDNRAELALSGNQVLTAHGVGELCRSGEIKGFPSR